ncbi:Uncharacterised protein [Staphylococcus epidermidis]|uniref:hypothetical protein n=1 Tax=Staphylococcus epidermidis TaxID=1282 RepID=UPI000DFDFDD2|nr:hypothetical protein [Staphylococcus epidermidis]SUM53558.1 Uncharacterised protein [Staphylococcus epidermidis]
MSSNIMQFDVIEVTKVDSKRESIFKKYVVVSNNLVNNASSHIWVQPIEQRRSLYVTDIPLLTKRKVYDEYMIDSGKIECVNSNQYFISVVDKVQPRVQKMMMESIQAHTDIV